MEVKPGLTRRVRPGLGNRRQVRTSARHHSAGRHAVCACGQQPARRAGVTARCPSCHSVIKRASVPLVAIHWSLAPPACSAYAWHEAVEPGIAPGRCSV